MANKTFGPFKRWFWRPPQPHGETIAERTVSFLELFYDLVYVAVIAQAVLRSGRTITVCQGDAYAATADGEVHCATMTATMIRVDSP